MTGKSKYGDEGWNQEGKQFYNRVLQAIKETDFGSEDWLLLWKKFWKEERKKHFEERELKSDDNGVQSEVESVGELWDENDMVDVGLQWDNKELESFKPTRITGV